MTELNKMNTNTNDEVECPDKYDPSTLNTVHYHYMYIYIYHILYTDNKKTKWYKLWISINLTL